MKYTDFAKIIKEQREQKFITQKAVALELAIPQITYNRIENGKQEPTFLQLQRICNYFNINLTELFQNNKPNHHIYD